MAELRAEPSSGFTINSDSDCECILRSIQEISIDEFEQTSDLLHKQFKKIIDKYIERPHLLDPYFETIFNLMYLTITQNDIKKDIKIKLFYHIHYISNLRKSKKCIKFINHDETNIDVILSMLNVYLNEWKATYCLLMWLVSVLTAPFPLFFEHFRLNSVITLIQNLIHSSTNPYGALIPLLCSNFLNRTDISDKVFLNITDSFLHSLRSNSISQQTQITLLTVLTYIFKKINRSVISELISCIDINSDMKSGVESSSVPIRKQTTKFIQRVAIKCLKVKKSADEFYEKLDQRAEENNISCSNTTIVQFSIQNLLTLMGDANFDVRYSCSKGLARISVKLSSTQRKAIVAQILSVFKHGSTYYSQAGCLGLAEFACRGLLEASQLPDILPHVLTSLFFEEHATNVSVSASVRDSACYVLWGFARAFHPLDLKPYIKSIIMKLILTSLFDAQIICRKASSAALQEIIGRQGNYEGGIELVTIIDFHTVSNVKRCYLEICPSLSKNTDLIKEIVDNLMNYHLNSFHSNIQKYTAKALGRIALFNPDYIVNMILPLYFNQIDQNMTQPSLYCLVCILDGLNRSNIDKSYYSKCFTQICDVLTNIKNVKFTTYFSMIEKTILQLKGFSYLCRDTLSECYLDKWLSIITLNLYSFAPTVRIRSLQTLFSLKQFQNLTCETYCKNYYVKNWKQMNSRPNDQLGFGLFLHVAINYLCTDQVMFVVQHFTKLIHDNSTSGVENATNYCNMLHTASCVIEHHFGTNFNMVERIIEKYNLFITDFVNESQEDISKKLRISAVEGVIVYLEIYIKSLEFKQSIIQSSITALAIIASERDDARKIAIKCLIKLILNPTFDRVFENINVLKTFLCSIDNEALSYSDTIRLLLKSRTFYDGTLRGLMSSYNSPMYDFVVELMPTVIIPTFMQIDTNQYFMQILIDSKRSNRLYGGIIYFIFSIFNCNAQNCDVLVDSCIDFLEWSIEYSSTLSRVLSSIDCLKMAFDTNTSLKDRIQHILSHKYKNSSDSAVKQKLHQLLESINSD